MDIYFGKSTYVFKSFILQFKSVVIWSRKMARWGWVHDPTGQALIGESSIKWLMCGLNKSKPDFCSQFLKYSLCFEGGWAKPFNQFTLWREPDLGELIAREFNPMGYVNSWDQMSRNHVTN